MLGSLGLASRLGRATKKWEAAGLEGPWAFLEAGPLGILRAGTSTEVSTASESFPRLPMPSTVEIGPSGGEDLQELSVEPKH